MFLRYFFCEDTYHLSKFVLNILNFLKLYHCWVLHDYLPFIFNLIGIISSMFCTSAAETVKLCISLFLLLLFSGGQFFGKNESPFSATLQIFHKSSVTRFLTVLYLLKIYRSFQKLQTLFSLKYDLLWPFAKVFRFIKPQTSYFRHAFSYVHQYCCQMFCLLVGYYQLCSCP